MARCFERVLQTGSEVRIREKVLLFSLLVDILIVLYSLRCWGENICTRRKTCRAYDKAVEEAEEKRDKAVSDAKRAIYGEDYWRY